MTHHHRLYGLRTIDLDDLQRAADTLRCSVILSGRDDNTLGVLVTMDRSDCEEGVNNFAEFEEALSLSGVEWSVDQSFGDCEAAIDNCTRWFASELPESAAICPCPPEV